MRGMCWIHQATCANPQYDPSWWDCNGNSITSDNKLAMCLCLHACPVIEECRAETQKNPNRYQGTIRHGERVPTATAIRKRKTADLRAQ